MQLFVRGNSTMIAAPVQGDVDGISKGSHYASLSIAIGRPQDFCFFFFGAPFHFLAKDEVGIWLFKVLDETIDQAMKPFVQFALSLAGINQSAPISFDERPSTQEATGCR